MPTVDGNRGEGITFDIGRDTTPGQESDAIIGKRVAVKVCPRTFLSSVLVVHPENRGSLTQQVVLRKNCRSVDPAVPSGMAYAYLVCSVVFARGGEVVVESVFVYSSLSHVDDPKW